jgi:DNA end-binding protein Ku
MRPIGGGTISFGLVSIPVKMYSASQSSAAISFNLLHAQCGGRLKQQYICPREDNMIVERDQMVKGYEFAKDRYVTFTPEELKALEEKASSQIEIAEFVPSEKIDPVYFDKPYYLGPEQGADRAYRLLTEAMRKSGKTALARYAARGKQYLVQIRPLPEGQGLVMQQLLYADEVRPFSEVGVEPAEVKEPELKLAEQIIEQISTDAFEPEKYKDEVRERVQEQIQRKVEGQQIQIEAPQAQPTQIIDLMEALKASLAAKGLAPAASAKPAAPPKPGLAAVQPEAPAAERKPAKRAPREASAKKASSKK